MATAEPQAGAVELLLALKTVPPFSTLPPDDLALFVDRARHRTFAPGALLYAAGAPISTIHLVMEGRVTETRAGRPWAVREAYELVGGVDALASTGDDVVVTAESATRTLELDREAVIEICYDRFSVLATVTAGIAAMAIAARRRLGPSAGYPATPPETTPIAAASRLGLPERMSALRALPALATTRVQTLGDVAAACSEIALDTGRAAWQAGDPADHIVVILSGTVACATADGVQRFVLGRGDVLGDLDALATVPRWYAATATTPVRALHIRVADLLDVLEDDPETAVEGLTRFATATAALVDQVARDMARS
jgi:CRP-like cAMP-binding protein